MTINKVALIGANGTLGPAVLKALLSTFEVTVISRASSKSTYPDSVRVIHTSDDHSHQELVDAFKGQDAVVVTFAGSNSELQIKLADAAKEAGVKRFIPADFGSCDATSQLALDLMPLYRKKLEVQQYLKNSGLPWTSIVSGHFFDYGLTSNLLQFDLHQKKVNIFDGGDIKWSATTLETIGLAVVRVLQLQETENMMLFIESFNISQNDLLKSLEKFMGKWEVIHTDSKNFIEVNKAETDKDPKNAKARENLVSVVGIIDGNWEDRVNFANKLLGIKMENLDQAVKKVIDKL